MKSGDKKIRKREKKLWGKRPRPARAEDGEWSSATGTKPRRSVEEL
jgi:hypothetical protein